MITWTKDELNKVAAAEELDISSLRSDGTLRKRVTIWVVRVGDNLYIRSARAQNGVWYRNAKASQSGRIWAGGVQKDVSFVEVTDAAINDQIDAAYLSKYGRYPQYVTPMVTSDVRNTTLKLEIRTD